MYNKHLKEILVPTNDQLRAYPLFSDLNDADLAQIVPCLSKRIFGKGAYLYHPGNPAVNAYMVEAGLVRLFFTNKQGDEHLIYLVGPRNLVGLPMLFADQVREVGAMAVQPTTVWALSQKDLAHFAQCFPQLTQNIYRLMDLTLRALLRAFQMQVILDINGRLACTILYLSRLSVGLGTINEFILPVSQAELATWLGASRGHLNRALSHLQQLGLIRLKEQKLTILDRPGLLRLTEDVISE
jgi:CRP-like cAMP-binding protein